ncbi:MAG: CtsR family transcriptional regulator [Saccharofermentanales bacterium]|jgi:transcriptional regulator CtsR
MSSLTDRIERTILELMEERDGFCEIARNAFAAELEVAPSQITYVIATRFGHRQGYVVESRRGGAGYVRIRRIPSSGGSEYLMHLVRSLSDRLSEHQARVLADQLLSLDLISQETAQLLQACTSDSSLRQVDARSRDRVRSDLAANLLARIAAWGGGEE